MLLLVVTLYDKGEAKPLGRVESIMWVKVFPNVLEYGVIAAHGALPALENSTTVSLTVALALSSGVVVVQTSTTFLSENKSWLLMVGTPGFDAVKIPRAVFQVLYMATESCC
jgi:hypothetical protein